MEVEGIEIDEFGHGWDGMDQVDAYMPTYTHVLMNRAIRVGTLNETNEYCALKLEEDVYSDDVVNMRLDLSANSFYH